MCLFFLFKQQKKHKKLIKIKMWNEKKASCLTCMLKSRQQLRYNPLTVVIEHGKL